ncbi:MAG: 30S ribosomal protein S8 [Nitrospiraceae bacterium]
MMTDPIADLLVRIQNGARRRHDAVTVPASKLKREVLRILQAEGFIETFDDATEDGHPALHIQLRYVGDDQPMITGLRRISRPGKRVYVGKRNVPRVRSGIGVSILSTSKGVMTDQESRRSGLGGEVLCHVW